MRIILLISIFLTLAPVHMGHEVFFSGNSVTSDLESSPSAKQPCQDKSPNDAYSKFTKKHILDKRFDRESKDEWKKYLESKNLCGRTPVQSFMESEKENVVKNICSSSGRRLMGGNRNLCISTTKIPMYNVMSKLNINVCVVTDITNLTQVVVVGCNKVENVCLPVHFQKYNNQKPDNNKPCSA